MASDTSHLTSAPSLGGSVVAIDDGDVESAAVDGAAELYARMTGRTLRSVSSVEELGSTADLGVVVASEKQVTSDLLTALYVGSTRASAPGIVCAPAERLGAVARERAIITLRRAPLVTPRRVDFLPTAELDTLMSGDVTVIGGESALDVRRAALTRGAGVLTIITHADGIDAFLGEGLTLCPLASGHTRADLSRAPRCAITGRCHRARISGADLAAGRYPAASTLVPVDEAIAARDLMSPDELRARIAILALCSGLLEPGGVIDPVWGYGIQLAMSSSVGALVTTWQTELIDPEQVFELAAAIAEGEAVGQAVARSNVRAYTDPAAVVFCLLGDPDLRLPARARRRQRRCNSRAARSPRARPRTVTGRPESDQRATFLADYLATFAGQLEDKAAVDLQEARALVAAYDYAIAAQTPVEGTPEALGPTMRRAVMATVFRHGSLICERWLHQAEVARVDRTSPCALCGLPSTMITATPAGLESVRRVRWCGRCGITEDAPADGWLRTASLAGNALVLRGSLPAKDWTGGLMIDPSVPSERAGYDWPIAPDGAPARSCAPRGRWPIGHVFIAAVFLVKRDIGVFGQFAREVGPRGSGTVVR